LHVVSGSARVAALGGIAAFYYCGMAMLILSLCIAPILVLLWIATNVVDLFRTVF
jgi:hypothetical protein